MMMGKTLIAEKTDVIIPQVGTVFMALFNNKNQKFKITDKAINNKDLIVTCTCKLFEV